MAEAAPDSSRISVLIVDDEADLRSSVISVLRSELTQYSFDIGEARDGQEAVDLVVQGHSQRPWDVVLMDVRMPKLSGIEALRAIRAHDPRTFVVLMTAHANVSDAISAIKEGAYDYLEKPVQRARLIEIFGRALEARALLTSVAANQPLFDDDIDTELVQTSSRMRDVFTLIQRLSQVDAPVLIRGERGTGKELVAKAVHLSSPRKSAAFVKVDCSARPWDELESELFGHEKGYRENSDRKIGSLQLANQGTLFLDEIGDLRPDIQLKLFRVLEERRFTPLGSHREIRTETRIIASTRRNLERMVEEESFREELFYKLSVLPIFLPPLRERSADIPELCRQFLRRLARNLGAIDAPEISPQALRLMQKYHWPGNIRELENVIDRAFILSSGREIGISDLPESLIGENSASDSVETATIDRSDETSGKSGLDFETYKERAERDFIINALRLNRGRINKTVATANIPKNTLLRKIRKYAINPEDFKDLAGS